MTSPEISTADELVTLHDWQHRLLSCRLCNRGVDGKRDLPHLFFPQALERNVEIAVFTCPRCKGVTRFRIG